MKQLILIFILSYCAAGTVLGQIRNQVSGDFTDVTFSQFVAAAESQTDYIFYYDRALLDSFKVNIRVKDAFMQPLLTSIFQGSDFKFIIDKDGRVFITSGRPLQQGLPSGFLQGQPIVKTEESVDTTLRQQNRTTALEQRSAIENKVFEIGTAGGTTSGKKTIVSGYAHSAETGEELSGVEIRVDSSKVRLHTDQFGYYSIQLDPGHYTLHFSIMGKFDTRRQMNVLSDGKLDVDLHDKVIQLKEVVIETDKARNIRSTEMGVDKLNMEAIRQIPAVMGEMDVLRAVLNLPGVKSVGEATTGINVRGGGTDQNLILFNDLNLYNPTHLFGFFSAIDPDLIKNVNLYKSSIPAKYGGRISSVLDIVSLDGNANKVNGSLAISPVTSRIAVNGPIAKGKTTFAAGIRSTYSDWVLKLLPDEYKHSDGSFYDGTIHVKHELSKKDQLYLNGYYSHDRFALDENTRYQYRNTNGNIKWKHNYKPQFYSVLTAGFDDYAYKTQERINPFQASVLNYAIRQYKANMDFSYFLNNRHTLGFGISSKLYKTEPGQLAPWGTESFRVPDTLQKEQGLESAIYFSDQFNISNAFSLDAGTRLNVYNFLGPYDLTLYPKGQPHIPDNISGTREYGSMKFISTNVLPDFRIGARYAFNTETSVKASVNTVHQFIHQISNTTAISPTDIWKLSNPYITPQEGEQVSLGFYRNLKSNTIETSVEVYYKRIHHYLDYKSGAQLLMNHHLETDLINTTGKAYGVEVLIKKSTGKLNGWISYTYSRAFTRQDDRFATELVNNGEYYPANFDQPHSVAFVGNYKLSHRFSVSLNANYNTGRPITLPIGTFEYDGAQRVLYSDRNAYRVPDYIRTDFSMNIEGNHNLKQTFHSFWTLGVFNFIGRRNPYSIYFITENGKINGYKLSIFGSAIPYLTYNIRF